MMPRAKRCVPVLLVWLLVTIGCLGDAATDQFNFAEGLYIQQDYTSALEEYQAYLTKYPQHEKAGTARYRIGECQFRQNKWAVAATAFEAALKAAPEAEEAPLSRYNLGRCYLTLKEPAKALEPFQTAAQAKQPELREEASLGAGECLVQLAKWDEAAKLYAAFRQAFPASKHTANVLFSQGWVLSQAGQYAAAIGPFKELLAKHADFAGADKARLALSDAYTETGKFDEATKLLSGMTGGPEAEAALLRLAWTQYKQGKGAEAAASFVSFADKYPKSDQVASALFNAGIADYDRKAYAEAVTVFERLRKERPASAEAADMRLWLGIALYQTKQYPKAITEFDAVLAAGKLDKEKLGTAAYTRAEAAAADGQTELAIAGFDKVVSEFPESRYVPNALYSKATVLQSANRLADAVDVLKGLLEKYPKADVRPNALFAIGEYLYRLKRPAEVVPYLQELLKAQGGKPTAPVLYRLAWAQFDTGNFAESGALFGQLAGLGSPFTTESRYMVGRSAESLGKTAEAVAAYEAVAGEADAGAFGEKARYRLAFLYDLDKAAANLTAYEKAYPQGEHLAAIQLKLAEQLFKADKVDEAFAMYEAASKRQLPPDLQATAWYGLGWCYLKQDKLAEASAAFARVAQGKPDETVAHDAMLQQAEIAYRQGNYEAAAPLFNKLAVAGSPVRERALYMSGWCAIHQEDNDAAGTCFETYLKTYPEGDFAPDASVRLASLLKQQGKFEQARDLLAKALDKATGELREELLYLYSDTLVSLKDWEGLIKVSGQLEKEFPESTRGYLRTFRLGLAYKELGVRDKAEEYFRQTIAATETIEAAKAQFNIAAMSYAAKEFLEAGKQYLRVDMLYNYPELSPKALYYAVESFVQAEGKESGRIAVHLAKLHDKYPDSPWTKKADELMAAPAAEKQP